MIRVLQVHTSDCFRAKVATYFNHLEDIRYRGESSEEKLLELLHSEVWDVVLLDLNLEPNGGFSALEQIRTQWTSDQIKVVLISETPPGEVVLAKAANLGADYVLLRPVDLVVLEKRIRQLLKPSTVPPSREVTLRQVQEICSGYFERMGVPPHYKGYRYLLEGIWLAALHSSWLNSVTRKLYPAIGQRFGVSGAQVERAMRYAIDRTWEKGNLDQLYQIFPYIRENKGKPTNSIFIARMVDLVGLELDLSG